LRQVQSHNRFHPEEVGSKVKVAASSKHILSNVSTTNVRRDLPGPASYSVASMFDVLSPLFRIKRVLRFLTQKWTVLLSHNKSQLHGVILQNSWILKPCLLGWWSGHRRNRKNLPNYQGQPTTRRILSCYIAVQEDQFSGHSDVVTWLSWRYLQGPLIITQRREYSCPIVTGELLLGRSKDKQSTAIALPVVTIP
jgi:hypothetical protein